MVTVKVYRDQKLLRETNHKSRETALRAMYKEEPKVGDQAVVLMEWSTATFEGVGNRDGTTWKLARQTFGKRKVGAST